MTTEKGARVASAMNDVGVQEKHGDKETVRCQRRGEVAGSRILKLCLGRSRADPLVVGLESGTRWFAEDGGGVLPCRRPRPLLMGGQEEDFKSGRGVGKKSKGTQVGVNFGGRGNERLNTASNQSEGTLIHGATDLRQGRNQEARGEGVVKD